MSFHHSSHYFSRTQLSEFGIRCDFLTEISDDGFFGRVESLCFDSKNKKASMDFKHLFDNYRKYESLSQNSSGKLTFTVFLDVQGPVFTGFVSKGSAINSESYCDTLHEISRVWRIVHRSATHFFCITNITHDFISTWKKWEKKKPRKYSTTAIRSRSDVFTFSLM